MRSVQYLKLELLHGEIRYSCPTIEIQINTHTADQLAGPGRFPQTYL